MRRRHILEKHSISPEMEAKIIDQLNRRVEEKHLWKIAWRVFLAIITLFGIIGLITGWSILQFVDQTKESINDRIALEFQAPKIKETVEAVAKEQSIELLNQEISPEVQKFKLDISSKIADAESLSQESNKKFEKYLESMEQNYDIKYKSLSYELDKLEKRNKLTELADKAISQFSRSALNELESRYHNALAISDSITWSAAISEILRVKSNYASGSRHAGQNIVGTYPDGTIKREEDYTTGELIALLLRDEDWRIRARSATILENHKEIGVAEALLECAKKEENLIVLKESIRSFRTLTKFKNPDIFNTKYLEDWWSKNAENYNNNLLKE